MRLFFKPFVFLLIFVRDVRMQDDNFLDENGGITERTYMFWPNATIPFYINPEHFDNEQSTTIMTTLALLAFKTCLKFLPALIAPDMDQHVLVFENPSGVKKCVPSTFGHPMDEPHTVTLGYDCLRPPNLEMMVMKALGFPFEHNRATRDKYIAVQLENIDPSEMELFTKDPILPPELRALPYDVDSVMHFGERAFSKNGHRTIIFKDRGNRPVKQNRIGLSSTDLRKIEIVYGPECRKRDRQEKLEICKNYPGAARRKREVTELINLRVNRDITPPPNDIPGNVNDSLRQLGIEDEVQEVVDHVYKVSARALRNARAKYCNGSKADLRTSTQNISKNTTHDILGIIESIAEYATNMVENAVANLTEFCQNSENIEMYQRSRCGVYGGRNCPVRYKSTAFGRVFSSTQHRPIIPQSTRHDGRHKVHNYARSGNSTDEEATTVSLVSRRKRDIIIDDKNKTDTEPRDEAATLANQRSDNNSKNDLKTKMVGNETELPASERNRRVFTALRATSGESEGMSIEGSFEEKHRPVIRPKRKGKKIRNRELLRDQTEDIPPQRKLPKTIEISKQNREFYDERKWPEGIVRYMLDVNTNYDLNEVRARLEEVNRILKRRTCVQLEEISEAETENYEDYLVLDTSADYVTGRVGGKQNFGALELYRGEQHRQYAAMIVMAMLGFYFELARHDRDKYVRVHLRHVRPDKLHHFEKIRSDATFPLPYDYESATHPAWQFWRKIGKTGISCVATFKTEDPDGSIMKSMGQHEKLLSDMDIIKINTVYGTKCFAEKRTKQSGKEKQDSVQGADKQQIVEMVNKRAKDNIRMTRGLVG